MVRCATWWLAAAILAGCSGQDSGADPPIQSVVAPYPNDLFTVVDQSTGTGLRVDLPQASTPLIEPTLEFGLWKREQLIQWMRQLDGFSTFGPIFFQVDQALDSTTLPETEAESIAADSPLFLVELERGAPAYGQRIPISVKYRQVEEETVGQRQIVAISPQVPLRPGALHGVVALRTIRDAQGQLLRRSDLLKVLAGEQAIEKGHALESRLERGSEQIEPLFAYLAEAGIASDDVAEAFVFTTQSASALIASVREYLHSEKAPPLAVEWLANYAPDKLPDLPATIDPGVLSDVSVIVTGQFDAPDLRDANGEVPAELTHGRVLTIPFIIALPVPTGKKVPIVVLQHGHGNSKESALHVAPYLAKRGIATAAIDLIGHGALEGEGSFVEILRVPRLRGNFVQSIANGLRLVQALGSIDAVQAGDVSYGLERSRGIGYVGESMGGICGTPLAGVEPGIKAVVLNVTGGGLAASIVGSYLAAASDRKLLTKVGIVAFFQSVMDSVDPVNFARRFSLEPADGEGKQVLMQNVASDKIGFETVHSLARAMGASYICPPCPEEVEMEGLPRKAPPTTGPGLFYFPFAKHGFLLEEGSYPDESRAVRAQVTRFFETYFDSGTGVIIDPYAPGTL